MAEKPSPIETVREEIAGVLRTVPALSGAEVFTRKQGDIENAIQTLLGNVGVSLEVVLKSAPLNTDSSDVVVYRPIYSVVAYEDVLVNQNPETGTGKTAFFLIVQATLALKNIRTTSAAGELTPDEAGPQQGKIVNRSAGFVVTQDFTTVVQAVTVHD